MKLVFIASLERSGSTILDLLLGSHPDMISLGEVERVIKPHGAPLSSVGSLPCTCGATGSTCPFWSQVLTAIDTDPGDDLAHRYRIFAREFEKFFGPEMIAVDSSKNLRALKAIMSAEGIDPKVVFTVRDVRGWISSIRSAEKRRREMPLTKIFSPDFNNHWIAYIRLNVLRRVPLWLAFEWMMRNQRIRRFLKRNAHLKTIDLSYEEVALNTEQAMDRLSDCLGLADAWSASEATTKSHIIRGNRTAFSTKGVLPLKYDDDWKRSFGLNLILALLPNVAARNRQWVYRFEARCETSKSDGKKRSESR